MAKLLIYIGHIAVHMTLKRKKERLIRRREHAILQRQIQRGVMGSAYPLYPLLILTPLSENPGSTPDIVPGGIGRPMKRENQGYKLEVNRKSNYTS